MSETDWLLPDKAAADRAAELVKQTHQQLADVRKTHPGESQIASAIVAQTLATLALVHEVRATRLTDPPEALMVALDRIAEAVEMIAAHQR